MRTSKQVTETVRGQAHTGLEHVEATRRSWDLIAFPWCPLATSFIFVDMKPRKGLAGYKFCISRGILHLPQWYKEEIYACTMWWGNKVGFVIGSIGLAIVLYQVLDYICYALGSIILVFLIQKICTICAKIRSYFEAEASKKVQRDDSATQQRQDQEEAEHTRWRWEEETEDFMRRQEEEWQYSQAAKEWRELMEEQARWRRQKVEEDEAERERQEQKRRRKREAQGHRREQEHDREDSLRYSQSGAWFAKAQKLLKHKESMMAFPILPPWKCKEQGCQMTPPLHSCRHLVKSMFELSDKGYEKELKQARVQWHPDKFTRCGEQVKGEIMEAVEEFAKILNGLWDELDER